jgi:hypothetical protein
VDISPAGVSVPAGAHRTGVDAALIRLALAAIGVFSAVGGGYELVRLMTDRNSPSSLFAIFGGWQVDAMAAVLGLLLLALLVICAIVLLRRYRGLQGRTPHRRAVVLAALLPGLFIGTLFSSPMRSAVSWASDHTASAHQAMAEFRQFEPTNPKAPPTLGLAGAAAPAALADHLLHASDLGTGWYDGVHPNPSELSGGLQGQTLSVRSNLSQWHWTGTMWAPGSLLLESLRRFATPAAADSYLSPYREQPKNIPGPSFGPTTQLRVGNVLVYEHTTQTAVKQLRSATFAVGTDVFTVDMDATASDYAALIPKAVRRATTGR